MADELAKDALEVREGIEKDKRRAVIDVIGGKVVSEGIRRDEGDLARSMYAVFMEVGTYLTLILDEVRKEEKE